MLIALTQKKTLENIVYFQNICSDVTPESRRRHAVRPYLTTKHNELIMLPPLSRNYSIL
jgi:hypothetical protein